MSKVLIFDTSILCVLLQVPGKESCGPTKDAWTKKRVDAIIEREPKTTIFVLPLATILETGNHIAQAARDRHGRAKELGKLIALAADGKSPWAAFTHQSELWSPAALHELSQRWPEAAARRLSIGDATISKVAQYYQSSGFSVEILTGDEQLKSLEPAPPPLIPRRRAR